MTCGKKHMDIKKMIKSMERRTGKKLEKTAKVLTTAGRKRIKEKNFALPGGRYPIHDRSHARAALSMVAKHGTPEQQATVRSKVHSKYPGIGKQAALSPESKDRIIGGALLTNLLHTNFLLNQAKSGGKVSKKMAKIILPINLAAVGLGSALAMFPKKTRGAIGMNKKALLKEVYESSFNTELEKTALKGALNLSKELAKAPKTPDVKKAINKFLNVMTKGEGVATKRLKGYKGPMVERGDAMYAALRRNLSKQPLITSRNWRKHG